MKTGMTKRTAVPPRITRLFPFCFLLAVLLLPIGLQAAPDISARYIKAEGSQLVIEIDAGSSPPSSVILIQNFPPGVTMLSSHPGASNYSPDRNKAKWLLKNISPGRTTVSVTLDRPVSRSEISTEIRFVPSQGGKMKTVTVE